MAKRPRLEISTGARRGKVRRPRVASYRASLQEIADLMSGVEWDADVMSAVADVVRSAGFTVEDVA